jgi:hypothetical protein
VRAPGKLFNWWQVYCAVCQMASPLIGQQQTQAGAVKELRAKYGWLTRRFELEGKTVTRWCCGNCARITGNAKAVTP